MITCRRRDSTGLRISRICSDSSSDSETLLRFATSQLLEFDIGTTRPVNGWSFKVFSQNARVTDATDIEGFHRLTDRHDLDKLFKDAKLLPSFPARRQAG